MNLASVQTMASGKLSCLACRSSMRSSLRSPSSSSALSKASFVQRRIVGSGSLPSAQARTVVRTATNRFTTSARHESRTTMTQQQHQHQQQQHSQQHGAKCLHSSSHQDQSTLAATARMEFMTPASHVNLSASSSSAIPRPTFAQLKELFFASSVSFIGFGFVDNIVMISSGSWIDATLGVKFGLATMTAAAMGQVVSDVSGVVFGGTMERFLKQWNLVKEPSLSAAQRGLTLCRNVSLAGSAFGVMLGCMLGACSLLFMDLESHERQKNAIQLRSIVQDMMMSSSPQDDSGLNCESCTVLLADGTKGFASLRAESSQQHSTRRPEATIDFLQHAGAGRAAECAKRRDVITNVCDQVMYVPVISVDGSNLLAVIEFRNKKSSAGTFTEEDEQTAKIMARHVAIFMQHLS